MIQAEQPSLERCWTPLSRASTCSQDSGFSTDSKYLRRSLSPKIPKSQQQLLVTAPKEPFQLTDNASIPALRGAHEILIRIDSVGLNPIDWKSPAYGFGLPSLPCVLGRDFVGTVVKVANEDDLHDSTTSVRAFQAGDVVLAISTDYRDYRKAAFQQFAVASDFNICRLPSTLQHLSSQLPAIGVAFVTAAISLGVCLGLDFTSIKDTPGPDLFRLIRNLDRNSLAEDIREECFDSLPEPERLKSGDWLAIWGASSTIGFLTLQLAKKAGVKVVCVADLIKNGSRLLAAEADVLVHRSNPDEAVDIVRSITQGKRLRYGVDTVGKDTAHLLQTTFDSSSCEQSGLSQHLVCLVGSPKEQQSTMKYHKLPMKLFHESPEVGRALMDWLEDFLFTEDSLILPKIDVHPSSGLQSVTDALERLQSGNMDGQRMVVEFEERAEAESP